MEELGDRYQAGDPAAVNMHNNYDLVFIPLFNPYGIQFLSRYNANTVDLNRNYDYDWASDISPFKGSHLFQSQRLLAIVTSSSQPESHRIYKRSHSAVSIPVGFTWAETNGIPTPIIAGCL